MRTESASLSRKEGRRVPEENPVQCLMNICFGEHGCFGGSQHGQSRKVEERSRPGELGVEKAKGMARMVCQHGPATQAVLERAS